MASSALDFKERGNREFQAGKYKEAEHMYTIA